MTEIVDRIASIINEWEDSDEPDARVFAPRILEAIRTPNKAMVNAALHWQSHCSDADSLFEQMIGAALDGESLPPHPMLKLYDFNADKPQADG